MNPDGYRYSYTEDRLWRKNRATNNDTNCKGVDLNRNHDYNWSKKKGTDENPCSDVYPGAFVEDQLETIAKRDFMSDKWNNTILYLSIHSALDAIFVPPGDLDDELVNNDDHYVFANRMKRAIGKSSVNSGFYKGFEVEASIVNASSLGETTGTADDWALANNSTFAFTIELPPENAFPGQKSIFIVPPPLLLPILSKYIKVSCQRFLFIVISISRQLKQRGKL